MKNAAEAKIPGWTTPAKPVNSSSHANPLQTRLLTTRIIQCCNFNLFCKHHHLLDIIAANAQGEAQMRGIVVRFHHSEQLLLLSDMH